MLLDELKTNMELSNGTTYQVIHINNLPKGWLGENHALYQGYKASTGDYIVFSDADVSFHKKTMSKVMHYVTLNSAEFLAMSPHFSSRSFALRAFIHFFLFTFSILVKPWNVFEAVHKRTGVGVGAFNLIKRNIYEKLGTHKGFAMEPMDDAELGKRANVASLRPHFVVGKELIEVQWYFTLRQAILGFQKNFFLSAKYKITNVIGFSMLIILLTMYPVVGIFLFSGWHSVISGLSVLFLCILYFLCITKVSFYSYCLLLELAVIPWTVTCYLYTLYLSAYSVLKMGGIYWRDTFYPLEDLKKEKLILRKGELYMDAKQLIKYSNEASKNE